MSERLRNVPGAAPSAPGGPGSTNWVRLGPNEVDQGQGGAIHPVVSGRVTAIAVGPGGTRAYVGSANGGVWLTEDAGNTWTALDEWATSPVPQSGLEADSLSVGALAVSFGNARSNDVLFIGTGEPGGNLDGYFGVGIKSSTDGGATFSLEASNLISSEVYRIVIDPDNAAVVFAATTSGLYQRPLTSPFTTWNHIAGSFTNANEKASDVLVAGTNAKGNKTYYVAFASDQVYKSLDSGVTWNAVPGLNPSGRVCLAAGENDPSVIYALASDGALARLDSGTGGSFQLVSGVPKALFAGHQGWYDSVVAADPGDANTIYLLGDLTLDADWALSFYRGTITGGPGSYVFPFNSANDQTDPNNAATTANVPNDPTWIGRGIHPDGHAIAFATKVDGTHDGSIVWVGCDGGVFQSTSSGALGSFTSVNRGLNITQMTFIAQRRDTPDVLYAGCQDNGTIRFSLSPTPSWVESVEGDGGGVAINPSNGQQIIRQYIQARLSVSSDDGANWASAGLPIPVPGIEDSRSSFYGPIAVFADTNKTLVAFGTNRLWFRPDWTDPWVTLPTLSNPYAGGGNNLTQDVLDDPNPTVAPDFNHPRVPVTAIAFASASRLYVATSQVPAAAGVGQVRRLDLSNGTWAATALPALPSLAPSITFITGIAVEDPSAGTLYVSLGSNGGEHILYFDGSAWQSAGLSVGTLDVPCHAVAVDRGHSNDVYLGSDVGVWQGTKSGGTWTWSPFSQGLPEAAVTDLSIHALARRLRAATHGRGVWEIPLQPATVAPTVTGINPQSGPAAGGTSVAITGTGFTGATGVGFGNTGATNITVNSDTQITAISPQGTGTVHITVVTPAGTSSTSATDQFTYSATANAPTVTGVNPQSGPAAGGTSVVITGTGFMGATGVGFGNTGAPNITVNNDTQITATSPQGSGTVDITVVSPSGTSPTSAADQFTYSAAASLPAVTAINPSSGPEVGGTTVVITGSGFTGATGVGFGATGAANLTVNSDTQITATSPQGSGTVDITVVTPSGTSATSAADQFTYSAAANLPAVTAINPSSGAEAGGTAVTITGRGFTGATGVGFGATGAANVAVNSDTQITAVSPSGTGTVDVTVITPAGTSATSSADQFTYTTGPTAKVSPPKKRRKGRKIKTASPG